MCVLGAKFKFGMGLVTLHITKLTTSHSTVGIDLIVAIFVDGIGESDAADFG